MGSPPQTVHGLLQTSIWIREVRLVRKLALDVLPMLFVQGAVLVNEQGDFLPAMIEERLKASEIEGKPLGANQRLNDYGVLEVLVGVQ